MEKRKLTKADIDKVRHIEGFPIAKDEDIIALSDPPYYTACPNPFIEEFIHINAKSYDEHTDDYHREPFAVDVSEGKYDSIYKMHPYHTKVPYKAILRYILHYTKPGDIVFDGFCGTGMTGIAASSCAQKELIAEKEMLMVKGVQYGERKAILGDLSPIATFIASVGNQKIDTSEFTQEFQSIIQKCEEECGWMFETLHTDGFIKTTGRINFVIWSDVFICPTCGNEIVFWESAVDIKKGTVASVFPCSKCGVKIEKKDCERAYDFVFDETTEETRQVGRQIPVLINYTANRKKYEKVPQESDMRLLEKIENVKTLYWYPTNRMCEGDEARRNDKAGITNVHHFYTKRNLLYLACFNQYVRNSKYKIMLTRVAFRITKRYALTYQNGSWGAGGGPTSGTLYIPSLIKELPVGRQMETALKPILEALNEIKSSGENCTITTQSATTYPQIPNNSVDYIFIDPPFGSNLMYSELNFIWESWLKIYTKQKEEAIVCRAQDKGVDEYKSLIMRSLSEFYRIIKPNRWMTVEFHNSKNAVWNAIREAIQLSGFIIADVRALDKKKGSFIQLTSASAVMQDLVISAYKPKESFRSNFISNAGSTDTVWSFVRQHLENLPVVVVKQNSIEPIVERQAYLLFDRMVAYHILNGIPVPLDAVDFYEGLDDKFLCRDSMYFLPDQVNEYDTMRIKNDIEPIQLNFVVSNEKSAIAWLYQQLSMPQAYQELQPKFMLETKTIDKYETIPELSVLLEDNFLLDSKGKWYIPDRTKEADISKLREKKLLKEFEGYMVTKGNLRLFRIEAIRAGFAKLWTEKNYKLIVETAERLPESVIQEDDRLLMYYDLSLGRV